MKKSLLYLILLSSLLISCGVKKPAAQQETQTANEPVVTNDSLTFLGDLINDSTIHINYVYGIPFIIDDSVPMFLPPIDKNPEGYVSHTALSISYYVNENTSICGISNPIDSILWLNKCLNDLYVYSELPNTDMEPIHFYHYIVALLQGKNDVCFVYIAVGQFQMYCYRHKDYHKALDAHVCYYFDLEGNLLGKMHKKIPTMVDLSVPYGKPHELRKAIPNQELFQAEYFDKSINYWRFILEVKRPNTEYYCDE